ncbi:cyclic nucleotide-binding domain-containing protein [archaeon]|nr:MAG: cyclic nucleotide-binding domain-containing protein [archaeon]
MWDNTLERPGCAFSRSIGDGVAKTVGVTAEPEILEWNIKPEDRFAVIASDGVFEFITSQAVVNMIQKYPNKLEAAKQVVAEAYRLWLTFDDRTDDISIIIMTFDNIKPVPAAKPVELKRGMSRALSSDDLLRNSRPVRKVMSRTKRKDIAENWSKDEVVNIDFDKLPNTKTDEDIARLSSMLSKSFMFEALSPIQKDHIFKVIQCREVKNGEVIIKEGDQGDDMYIVDSGQFLVYKKDDNGVDQQIFGYNEEGAAFGELSLMYGMPRAASVVAKTDGKLWSLGRAAFRAVMMRGKSEGLLEIYQTIPVLNEQSIPALHRLCLSSKELHYEQGDTVINEANSHTCSWEMCVILTGVLKLLPKDGSKKRQLRAELSYFSSSEIGQGFSAAVAESNLKISCISKAMWEEVVGKERAGMAMKAELMRAKSKGVRLKPIISPFVVDENTILDKIKKIDAFALQHPITFISDYGYFGNFEDEVTGEVCTIKVYAKSKVHHHRMEKSILSDRSILSVLNKTQKDLVGLPAVFATYTDEKWAYLILKDHFVSDLSMAIGHHAIQDSEKPYLMACLYSAMCKVHSMGLIHRMINAHSCFITNTGSLKVRSLYYIYVFVMTTHGLLRYHLLVNI